MKVTFFLILFSVTAHAVTIQICNNSNEKLFVAIGWDEDTGVESNIYTHTVGWYDIEREKCRDLNFLPKGSSNGKYYYATGSGGSVWSGRQGKDTREGCIRQPGRFDITVSFPPSECANQNASAVLFRDVQRDERKITLTN